MRSILLASFALSMTLVFSGCEDTTKPANPPVTTGTEPKVEAPKDKMEPAPTPAPDKPADKPAEPK
jgi:hypothetical protein